MSAIKKIKKIEREILIINKAITNESNFFAYNGNIILIVIVKL